MGVSARPDIKKAAPKDGRRRNREYESEHADHDDDCEIDPETVNVYVQPGDVWTLGKHRMMCGDSTSPDKVRALTDAYFAGGGTQAMITVVGRRDLENALAEPDRYRSLLVRVGGFSARFVELEKDVQQEVLSRTLY